MPPFGLLNINKPAGITSREAVDRVQQQSLGSKAGHAGTLDPLATGVLVICVGQATRLVPYIQRMRKRYAATFLLGRQSETDDIEGAVVPLPNSKEPTRTTIDELLPSFVGNILQRPPAHSAVKIAGRRAYQLAREGTDFAVTPRTVAIHRIEVQRYEYPELQMEIECGSGTYVRSLGRDIGEALGTGAVMSALRRTAIGPFQIEQSVGLDDLSAHTFDQNLQSALMALSDLPRIELNDAQIVEIGHGRPIAKPSNQHTSSTDQSEWVAVGPVGQLVAILYEKRVGELWPRRNFI